MEKETIAADLLIHDDPVVVDAGDVAVAASEELALERMIFEERTRIRVSDELFDDRIKARNVPAASGDPLHKPLEDTRRVYCSHSACMSARN